MPKIPARLRKEIEKGACHDLVDLKVLGSYHKEPRATGGFLRRRFIGRGK